MSDYYWNCPCCTELMHWNDDGKYVEEIDDSVCSMCYDELQSERRLEILEELGYSDD